MHSVEEQIGIVTSFCHVVPSGGAGRKLVTIGQAEGLNEEEMEIEKRLSIYRGIGALRLLVSFCIPAR